MTPEEAAARRGVSGAEELDALQRGQEQSLSVEEMDRNVPHHFGVPGATQVPIPDPGERPGAVRIEDEGSEGDVHRKGT